MHPKKASETGQDCIAGMGFWRFSQTSHDSDRRRVQRKGRSVVNVVQYLVLSPAEGQKGTSTETMARLFSLAVELVLGLVFAQASSLFLLKSLAHSMSHWRGDHVHLLSYISGVFQLGVDDGHSLCSPFWEDEKAKP